jgi:hypothetical protein
LAFFSFVSVSLAKTRLVKKYGVCKIKSSKDRVYFLGSVSYFPQFLPKKRHQDMTMSFWKTAILAGATG